MLTPDYLEKRVATLREAHDAQTVAIAACNKRIAQEQADIRQATVTRNTLHGALQEAQRYLAMANGEDPDQKGPKAVKPMAAAEADVVMDAEVTKGPNHPKPERDEDRDRDRNRNEAEDRP